MGRAKETFGKKEVRSKQEKKRKEKAKRRLEKKEQGKKGFDDMIAYVDENGNISSTPPDLTKKKTEIPLESIETSVPKAEFRTNSNIRSGRVNHYDESKGYGFITDGKTRESVFVHVNDCLGEIEQGTKVEFETEKGLKGLKAINVKPV